MKYIATKTFKRDNGQTVDKGTEVELDEPEALHLIQYLDCLTQLDESGKPVPSTAKPAKASKTKEAI